jgi:hypothetical protein
MGKHCKFSSQNGHGLQVKKDLKVHTLGVFIMLQVVTRARSKRLKAAAYHYNILELASLKTGTSEQCTTTPRPLDC